MSIVQYTPWSSVSGQALFLSSLHYDRRERRTLTEALASADQINEMGHFDGRISNLEVLECLKVETITHNTI